MTSKQITFTALIGLAVLFGCKKDDAHNQRLNLFYASQFFVIVISQCLILQLITLMYQFAQHQ